MAKLKFNYDEVMNLVEHTQRADKHAAPYGGPSEAPGIWIVGDQGVYLMSNGSPGLCNDAGNNVVVYAEGLNPHKDDDWWEVKRATFGGDDGADEFPAVAFEELARRHREKKGHAPKRFVIDIGPKTIGLRVE